MRYLGCFLLVIFLYGCSQEELLQRFSTPADQAVAKNYIERLRSRDFDEIDKAFDESIKGRDLPGTLAKMADLIPAGEPTSVKLVGAERYVMRDTTTVNTTYEYNFAGTWLLINVAVRTKAEAKTIVGFHVRTEKESLEVQNRFTFSGRSLLAYVVLGLAVCAALFSFYALVICIRTPMAKRKALWIVFILLGIGKISINWATGQWGVYPLYVQLFSASAFAQFSGPWVISASVPLGAILFLVRRKELTSAPS